MISHQVMKTRKEFLRAWIWATIHSWTGGQVFLYLKGPGGTGKSTFANLLIAIAGKENTVNTTLKDLATSPFETSFLADKKLIILSDIESYKGDLSIIKQISGGDPLRGRRKYSNNNFDVDIMGTMVMTGNSEITSRDTQNALGRRLRVFPADNVCNPKDRKPLIIYDKREGWTGQIANELSAIFYWGFTMDPHKAKKLISETETMVPSLEECTRESKENLNPLLSWIQDELEPGEGSYIGFKMRDDIKGYIETSRRKPLYPTYRIWAKKREVWPLGHKRFSSELLWTLGDLKYKVKKIKKTEGMYVYTRYCS
uniref:SF3 helicase domain-containing protein n=1 Tax=Treubia lacunosa TaxID=93845 RepID=G4Y9V8_9MARC|nr:hypothetical protein TrlaMp60 [Treubia lacunosa]AEH99755.1 hypothetical protein TrlaMp60 [Treubia lacunosa]